MTGPSVIAIGFFVSFGSGKIGGGCYMLWQDDVFHFYVCVDLA